MGRPPADHVNRVRDKLRTRLRGGVYRAGDRFLSNRAVAELYSISYQTAHRVIGELVCEGLLERRPQSGTYVAGPAAALDGVELVFDRRAQRGGSFGAKLLERVQARLESRGIACRVQWARSTTRVVRNRLPVVWECPQVIQWCVGQQRPAVVLNDAPPAGLGSLFIDSVRTDDFSGGATAAQLLLQQCQPRGRLAILAGPRRDDRSDRRIAGFRSVVEPATVVHCDGWFMQDAYRRSAIVLREKIAGIFCCNDRLAEGLIHWCQGEGIRCPGLVGFDDAPIAEELGISTIAIPWDELVEGTISTIRRRISGDSSTGAQLLYAPRPVLRDF